MKKLLHYLFPFLRKKEAKQSVVSDSTAPEFVNTILKQAEMRDVVVVGSRVIKGSLSTIKGYPFKILIKGDTSREWFSHESFYQILVSRKNVEMYLFVHQETGGYSLASSEEHVVFVPDDDLLSPELQKANKEMLNPKVPNITDDLPHHAHYSY